MTKKQIKAVREVVDNSVRVESMGTHYLVAERAYTLGLQHGRIAGLREAAQSMDDMPCPPEWGEIPRWKVWGYVADYVGRMISRQVNAAVKKARTTP